MIMKVPSGLSVNIGHAIMTLLAGFGIMALFDARTAVCAAAMMASAFIFLPSLRSVAHKG